MGGEGGGGGGVLTKFAIFVIVYPSSSSMRTPLPLGFVIFGTI